MHLIFSFLLFSSLTWANNDASPTDPITLSFEEMDEIIDHVKEVYAPVFAEKGLDFVIKKKWDSFNKNAYADRTSNEALIVIEGGLARTKYMSPDHFTLILCHEIGHHFGGAPYQRGVNSYWSSAEGQADYYAAKICMKKVLRSDGAVPQVQKSVQEKCSEQYPKEEEKNICLRIAKAGELFGKRDFLFTHHDLEPHEYNNQREISLTRPWGNFPDLTYRFTGYPSSQCRVDAFYQGALCNQETCDQGVGTPPFCLFSYESK